MLILGRKNKVSLASLRTDELSIDYKLDREWLLTNERGSFASGTVAGCNTRRYHGLLIGTLTPPANRINALSTMLETLLIDGQEYQLSTFEFADRFAPEGYLHQTTFRRDYGVHFEYELGPIHVTKSVFLAHDSDTLAIQYDFSSVGDGFTFMLRPFAAMRNFHGMQKADAPLHVEMTHSGLKVRSDSMPKAELSLRADSMNFEHNPQWWYNFHYRVDQQRGQDFAEDLWTPGTFKTHIEEPARLVLWAHLGDGSYDLSPDANIDDLCEDLRSRQSELLAVPHGTDKTFQKLTLAADQFVIRRRIHSKPTATIIAGYPWFMDWGRDTFISLPGLLLSTERFEEAASVLTTFAAAAEDGIIPNRFDDYDDKPHYNCIDASLWFVHAAFAYVHASRDAAMFEEKLLPVIRWIMDCYYHGTKFGIHADSDGLITGGNIATQLTWMDAKCGDTAFTPRYGKAVEINALWYNALCHLAKYYELTDSDKHNHYDHMAQEVAASFKRVFWNAADRCCFDCLLPDGTIDHSIRPNQIFAVSLPYSPLTFEQQRGTVDAVKKYLLTPYGLRTLNTQDKRYHGQITGSQFQRDEAYHQGTVWPWLIGGFIEAHLRINKFSRKSRREAIEYIRPLLSHLTDDACLGSISEVLDGDEPHRPAGAFAQAWSVAEVIRAYLLIVD